ncbi:DUF3105 domain-containing protein [Glycomyces arizonensis]|uniref:DUF3105 domain-containing protein n=1 Tax=Glycomyces arizonensis TaxID=256035 RepID=UPI0004214564|nr:DUF3105 domain-containing protein [Glycomyces arizonensis]
MITTRARSAALAAVCVAAFAAGCSSSGSDSGGDADGAAAPDAPTEIEGVQNFYGEYGSYQAVQDAIADGEVTAEDLEYPQVVQQEHVDGEAGWDGNPPVYELAPPVAGNHLSVWQTCNGSVYDGPITDGNAVHSMEHGAVWLTYDPELVDEAQIAALAAKIEGRDYSLMSPYPGQGVAVSLQSWGNQYQTDDPADPNIDAYLDTYILNEAFNPEAMATCSGGNSALAE